MKVKSIKIILLLSLISFLICGCNTVPQSQSNSPEPQIISPQKASSLAKSLPNYTGFSYTGLSFFEGKLYASSNIGLLEYESGNLSRLYSWLSKDDVVEDVSFDKANHLLWSFHSGKNKLIRFDGKTWGFVDLPKIQDGYTRGDMLHGFQGFSTDSAFWLQSERIAWRWNVNDNSWSEEAIPVMNCYVTSEPAEKDIGCYKSHIPVEDKVLVIMHREFMSSYSEAYPYSRVTPKPLSDRIFFIKDREWQEVPNKAAVDFVTKDVVVSKNAAYIKTIYGKLFRITTSEIIPIETIGEVEAMTTTNSGNLLVSFRNNGIYEYNNGWKKRFSSPYPSNEPEHFTNLAESNGQIAIAISSMSDKNGKNLGQTMLWISDGNELKPVPFE